jgi:hypothetical protein
LTRVETAESPAPTAGRFNTKVAIVLRGDLAPWQKLNVAAFLTSGIVRSVEDIIGQPYEDADGTAYLALCRQPITILEGTDRSCRRHWGARLTEI